MIFSIILREFEDDEEIKDKMDQIEKVYKQVFDKKNGGICHLPCKEMPEGLNEETYLLIHKKQLQCVRYHIN